MSWRSGPRETVKGPDPTAGPTHPLILSHREAWEEGLREKFRRLFAATHASHTTTRRSVGDVGNGPAA